MARKRKFTLEIECENSAFDERVAEEIFDILVRARTRIREYEDGGDIPSGFGFPLQDTNGNTVGHVALDPKD